MRIAHILVCHSLYPRRLINSIPMSADALWFVYFHGDDPLLADEIAALVAARGGTMSITGNRGVAKSWNDAIAQAITCECDSFLILNDDLFFYIDGYLDFMQTIASYTDSKSTSYITLRGLESGNSPLSGEIHTQSFSCCAITRETIDRIGFFDENFKPAYYEDCDYAYRARLSGLEVVVDDRVLVEHERSSTLRLLSADAREGLQADIDANLRYYIEKWGGPNGSEAFTRPFGGQLSLKIEAFERNDPYGANRRRLKSSEVLVVHPVLPNQSPFLAVAKWEI